MISPNGIDNYLYDLNLIYERIKYLKNLKLDPAYVDEIKPEIDEELKKLVEKYVLQYTLSKIYMNEFNLMENKNMTSNPNDDLFTFKTMTNIKPENSPSNSLEPLLLLTNIIDEIHVGKTVQQKSQQEAIIQLDESNTIQKVDYISQIKKLDKPKAFENSNKNDFMSKKKTQENKIQPTIHELQDTPRLNSESLTLDISKIDKSVNPAPVAENIPSTESNYSLKRKSNVSVKDISEEKHQTKQIIFKSSYNLKIAGNSLKENIYMVPMVTGIALIVGGAFLFSVKNFLPNKIAGIPQTLDILIKYLAIMPGFFIPSDALKGISFNAFGLLIFIIGFDILLLGVGIFKNIRLSFLSGTILFLISACLSLVSLLINGVMGSPFSIVSLILNALTSYYLYKQFTNHK